MRSLPAGAPSTWRLVIKPYSTARIPQAIAIKSKFNMHGEGTETEDVEMKNEQDEEPSLPAFSETFRSIFKSQRGKLQKCVIKLDSLTDTTGSLVDGVLELSFINQLRTDNDFIPNRIFIRKEMQSMFDKLVSKSPPPEEQRVLVGSPGIGKSVLCFLAALRRVVVHGERVMYVRKTRQEMKLSFFLYILGRFFRRILVIKRTSKTKKL